MAATRQKKSLLGIEDEWIVNYHEHDSLLFNIRVRTEFTKEKVKAAWEAYWCEVKKSELKTACVTCASILLYGNR